MRLFRLILVPALLLVLLAACAGQQFSTEVPDIELPSSVGPGQICWVRVDEPAPFDFASARYRATATYSGSGVGTGVVEVRLYGRTSEPSGSCTSAGSDDRPLSDRVALTRGDPIPFEAGGAAYGAAFAEVITTRPRYWLGVYLESWNLETDGRIEFTNGVVTVTL